MSKEEQEIAKIPGETKHIFEIPLGSVSEQEKLVLRVLCFSPAAATTTLEPEFKPSLE